MRLSNSNVIPAQAGLQKVSQGALDPRFRGGDGNWEMTAT